MTQPISTKVEGQEVWFEVDTQRAYGSEETSAVADKVLDLAEDAFERAKQTVTSLSKGMTAAIQSLAATARPDQFRLEFGIKFSGEGKVIVAKASAEASLKVVLTYNRDSGQ